jgi:hypothetical protein
MNSYRGHDIFLFTPAGGCILQHLKIIQQTITIANNDGIKITKKNTWSESDAGISSTEIVITTKNVM